jgi:hypothetical protein
MHEPDCVPDHLLRVSDVAFNLRIGSCRGVSTPPPTYPIDQPPCQETQKCTRQIPSAVMRHRDQASNSCRKSCPPLEYKLHSHQTRPVCGVSNSSPTMPSTKRARPLPPIPRNHHSHGKISKEQLIHPRNFILVFKA